MSKYLIVGNSAGGIAAIEAIRELDRIGSITLVSDEPYPAYSRPAIAEFLAGERGFDDRMLFRDREFYSRNQVDTRLGARVTKLDTSTRQAYLNDGSTLSWERLLLATGGTPIVPPMPGVDLEGVHSFVKADDARRVDQAIQAGAKRIVIVGGGLIGCSLTQALLHRGGVEITMVELRERVLTPMMDAAASRQVEARLQKLGVRVLTGRSVVKVLPASQAGKVGGALLDNGEQIPCDLVGMTVGVKPRVDLAQGTPILVKRGFVVDRHMETSAPGVFSCGDAAESYDFVFGANRVVAIWPNAYFGGRIAGFNMAGSAVDYSGCTAMNAFSYFNLALASAGMFDPESPDGYAIHTSEPQGGYRKLVLRGDKLVGFILLGDIDQAGVLYRLMREDTDVTEFRQHLLSDQFNMARLPKSLRNAWIRGDGAPQSQPVAVRSSINHHGA